MRERATVRLSPEGRPLLRMTIPVASDRVEATRRPATHAGWIEGEIPIESTADSARQLLRLGTEVEVVSPRTLRHAVAREAARVAEVHASYTARLPRE